MLVCAGNYHNRMWMGRQASPSLVPRPFGGGGKGLGGLLRAHALKLPQNVVIAYYSNLSATFVSILSVKAWERG